MAMFVNKVSVKIKKDKKYLQYIQIIRKYDGSLSMTQIKDAMEKGNVVFGFDPANNPIIHNGVDNSDDFLEKYFLKTLKLLKKAGADMSVMDGNRELVEFSKASSSKENLEKLIAKLFDAKDGTEAFNAIEKLRKTAKKSASTRMMIIDAMMKYSEQTRFSHMKSLIIPSINELVKENENRYADFYKEKIEHGDNSEAYYAIEGYAKVMQKAAYDFLVGVLLSRKLNVECEALIVCELSHLSKQPFDFGSPYEKPQWTDDDLKLRQIEKWKEDGYPDGNGYEEPSVHICLQEPETPEEKIYAALNKRLAKKREKNRDKAHPAYWLIQADANDIEMIKSQLNPPANYMDFLIKASPLNVEMNLKDYGIVLLYGAQDLLEGQYGYSVVPEESDETGAWPENFIVIATCEADPFCIDASQVNSPVYYAVHGEGTWNFDEAFVSLGIFLSALK